MASARRIAGICMMAVGMSLFLAMPFFIIRYGPAFAGLVFVNILLVACGAVLFGRSDSPGAPSAEPPAPVAEREPVRVADIPREMEPDVVSGFGCGFCSNCGSPLSPGDTFCGVCGRRL